MSLFVDFFFFQAEDGIRDYKVTGVQTCALPISLKTVPNAPNPMITVLLSSDSLTRRRRDRSGSAVVGVTGSIVPKIQGGTK